VSLTQLRPTPQHAASPRKSGRAKLWLHRFDTKTIPYVLIAPFFILFAIFGLFPIVFNAIVSLRVWRLDDASKTGWAGFANFTKLFGDSDFWNALYNTFGIFILSSVPQLIAALMIANLLNRKLRGNTFWRIGILLPYLTPVVASTLVFSLFFARDMTPEEGAKALAAAVAGSR